MVRSFLQIIDDAEQRKIDELSAQWEPEPLATDKTERLRFAIEPGACGIACAMHGSGICHIVACGANNIVVRI